MSRAVKISDEAYWKLSYHCQEAGITMREFLSELIIRELKGEIERRDRGELPELPQTDTELPKSTSRSWYARWMRGEVDTPHPGDE